IISAPVAKVPNAALVRRIERHSHEAAIAAPVWHELVYGVGRLPRGRRREALTRYVEDVVGSSFEILAYDEMAATWHGQERARLEKLGITTPFIDGQIGAIARMNELVLVTANSKDFVAFGGLRVEDWDRTRGR
ncbi:MAG: type II toxin-antitoxin system VapC family toxin, partial [Actinobacteria bacterium]|nr:type II toxin-antitoxin system VapC family toxin [Actinomycetota bacterium]